MKKLKWDSDFWGLDIIHLDTQEEFLFDKITSERFLVQALPEISDEEFIRNLELNGFFFKESKITLQKEKMGIVKIDDTSFQKLTLMKLKPYQKIFFKLFGVNSRFDIFPSDKVNDFYYTWMVNSIDGEMDDECIGHFIGAKLTGFITYRIRGSAIIIGLLGVLPEFQGRAISQLLLSYVDNVAIKNNINKVRISTQGKNIKALNAYIKNGYRIISINHWYYFTKGEIK